MSRELKTDTKNVSVFPGLDGRLSQRASTPSWFAAGTPDLVASRHLALQADRFLEIRLVFLFDGNVLSIHRKMKREGRLAGASRLNVDLLFARNALSGENNGVNGGHQFFDSESGC